MRVRNIGFLHGDWHGPNGLTIKQGEIADVSPELAHHLIEDYPKGSFELVQESPAHDTETEKADEEAKRTVRRRVPRA